MLLRVIEHSLVVSFGVCMVYTFGRVAREGGVVILEQNGVLLGIELALGVVIATLGVALLIREIRG